MREDSLGDNNKIRWIFNDPLGKLAERMELFFL